MALVIFDVIRKFEQGKADRRRGIGTHPYDLGSSEFFWWSKGWLEENNNLKGEQKVQEKL